MERRYSFYLLTLYQRDTCLNPEHQKRKLAVLLFFSHCESAQILKSQACFGLSSLLPINCLSWSTYYIHQACFLTSSWLVASPAWLFSFCLIWLSFAALFLCLLDFIVKIHHLRACLLKIFLNSLVDHNFKTFYPCLLKILSMVNYQYSFLIKYCINFSSILSIIMAEKNTSVWNTIYILLIYQINQIYLITLRLDW